MDKLTFYVTAAQQPRRAIAFSHHYLPHPPYPSLVECAKCALYFIDNDGSGQVEYTIACSYLSPPHRHQSHCSCGAALEYE